jgi:hypothetical protein
MGASLPKSHGIEWVHYCLNLTLILRNIHAARSTMQSDTRQSGIFMPLEANFPLPASSVADGKNGSEWLRDMSCFLRSEKIALSLRSALELRAGLEDDLMTIRSLVAAMQARKPMDLPAILHSLRYAGSFVAHSPSPSPSPNPNPNPNAPKPETRNRFDKQRLLKWMSEFSVAGQDAIYSSVTLMQGIRDAELGTLLVLERYEHNIRMAIHQLDEHLLESEPQTVAEACGLLAFVAGLLAADTTIDYPFFASLVLDCVGIIETNTGIAVKFTEVA